jgi:hypothetical protein
VRFVGALASTHLSYAACLNDEGVEFLTACVSTIEARGGLLEQGVYRNCGVASRVQRLVSAASERSRLAAIDLNNANEWEIRTITSAVKMYLRCVI